MITVSIAKIEIYKTISYVDMYNLIFYFLCSYSLILNSICCYNLILYSLCCYNLRFSITHDDVISDSLLLMMM